MYIAFIFYMYVYKKYCIMLYLYYHLNNSHAIKVVLEKTESDQYIADVEIR